MSNSEEGDEVLVFDGKIDKHVEMYEIPINEKDKIFLKTLFEADGPLTTTDIREKTGLERYDVIYRYKKFGEERYTEILSIEHIGPKDDPSINVQEVKQAELTDKGNRLIKQGLIGDPSEEHTKEDILVDKETLVEYQEEINRLESRINTLKNTLDQQKSTVNEIDSEVSSIGDDIKSLNDWKKRINVFVIAVKLAMEELGVNFGEHLKGAQEEAERREQE